GGAAASHDSIATDRAALDEITCFLRWHLGLTRPAGPRKRRRRRAATAGTADELPG
ncbi:alpha/beta hydrolase, partial [Ralstonia pseudosolanacearum]